MTKHKVQCCHVIEMQLNAAGLIRSACNIPEIGCVVGGDGGGVVTVVIIGGIVPGNAKLRPSGNTGFTDTWFAGGAKKKRFGMCEK